MKYRVYRGEHGNFTTIRTKLASISFVDNREVAGAYSKLGEHPKIYRVEIEINNPFFNRKDDPYVDFDTDIVPIFGIERSIMIALKFSDEIIGTSNWVDNYEEIYGDDLEKFLFEDPKRINNLTMLIWPLLDDNSIIDYLKNKGYDGAIYGGYGNIRPTVLDDVEYRIFNAKQIRKYFKN